MYEMCCDCYCKVLVVDVDGGKLLHSYGDEQHVIPRKLQKALVSSIKDDNTGNVIHGAPIKSNPKTNTCNSI